MMHGQKNIKLSYRLFTNKCSPIHSVALPIYWRHCRRWRYCGKP